MKKVAVVLMGMLHLTFNMLITICDLILLHWVVVYGFPFIVGDLTLVMELILMLHWEEVRLVSFIETLLHLFTHTEVVDVIVTDDGCIMEVVLFIMGIVCIVRLEELLCVIIPWSRLYQLRSFIHVSLNWQELNSPLEMRLTWIHFFHRDHIQRGFLISLD